MIKIPLSYKEELSNASKPSIRITSHVYKEVRAYVSNKILDYEISTEKESIDKQNISIITSTKTIGILPKGKYLYVVEHTVGKPKKPSTFICGYYLLAQGRESETNR